MQLSFSADGSEAVCMQQEREPGTGKGEGVGEGEGESAAVVTETRGVHARVFNRGRSDVVRASRREQTKRLAEGNFTTGDQADDRCSDHSYDFLERQPLCAGKQKERET
jgi:hypothetical protein